MTIFIHLLDLFLARLVSIKLLQQMVIFLVCERGYTLYIYIYKYKNICFKMALIIFHAIIEDSMKKTLFDIHIKFHYYI